MLKLFENRFYLAHENNEKHLIVKNKLSGGVVKLVGEMAPVWLDTMKNGTAKDCHAVCKDLAHDAEPAHPQRTVTQEYIDGIVEGRLLHSEDNTSELHLHIDNIKRAMRGSSAPMRDFYQGQLHFCQNRIKTLTN